MTRSASSLRRGPEHRVRHRQANFADAKGEFVRNFPIENPSKLLLRELPRNVCSRLAQMPLKCISLIKPYLSVFKQIKCGDAEKKKNKTSYEFTFLLSVLLNGEKCQRSRSALGVCVRLRLATSEFQLRKGISLFPLAFGVSADGEQKSNILPESN